MQSVISYSMFSNSKVLIYSQYLSMVLILPIEQSSFPIQDLHHTLFKYICPFQLHLRLLVDGAVYFVKNNILLPRAKY